MRGGGSEQPRVPLESHQPRATCETEPNYPLKQKASCGSITPARCQPDTAFPWQRLHSTTAHITEKGRRSRGTEGRKQNGEERVWWHRWQLPRYLQASLDNQISRRTLFLYTRTVTVCLKYGSGNRFGYYSLINLMIKNKNKQFQRISSVVTRDRTGVWTRRHEPSFCIYTCYFHTCRERRTHLWPAPITRRTTIPHVL